MTHSFWTHGPESLRRAHEDRRAQLAQLLARLETAMNVDERERLQAEIRKIRAEYTPTAQEIDRSLFLLR